MADFEAYRPHVTGDLAREAYRTGEPAKGMLDFGPAAVFADAIKPVESIFDEILDDAIVASARLMALMSGGRVAPAKPQAALTEGS